MSDRTSATKSAPLRPARPPEGVFARQGVNAAGLVWDSEPECVPPSGTLPHDTAAAPPLPQPPSGPSREREDFSRVHPVSPSAAAADVRDQDAAREMVTRWLLQQLAPVLGLDPAQVRVRVDTAAESRVNAHGASGVMDGQTVYLHPGRYAPTTAAGRYLLAHEVTHAAQMRLPRPVSAGPAAVRAAESEAARIGQAFARGETFARPTRPLDPARVAADTSPAASTAESAGPPKLVDSVRAGRTREIAQILDELSGLWISDGDVFDVMRLLDTMPSYAVRRAVISALGSKKRYELADNINPPHVYAHRMSVLACYDALESGEFGAVDTNVFRALPTSALTAEETKAVYHTLGQLADAERQDLFASNHGWALRLLARSPQPSAEDIARMNRDAEQAAVSEAKLADERTSIAAHRDDPAAAALLAQVGAQLGSSSGETPPAGERGPVAALATLGAAQKADQSLFAYVADALDQTGDGGANELRVQHARGFEAGNWVELSDETADVLNLPGALVRLAKVEGDLFTLDPLALTPAAATAAVWDESMVRPRVCRWDQTDSEAQELVDGVVPIIDMANDAPNWIDLEDGLQIQFTAGGEYRTGDYWLIPARVATGDIEWPDPVAGNAVARPPHGIEHHYAPLGLVTWDQNTRAFVIQSTCRCEFTPLSSCWKRTNKAIRPDALAGPPLIGINIRPKPATPTSRGPQETPPSRADRPRTSEPAKRPQPDAKTPRPKPRPRRPK